MHHHDARVTQAVLQASEEVAWTQSRAYEYFANTVVYPPLGYSPAVAGIWIGRALALGVDATLILTRGLGAVVAVGTGAAAIALAGPAAPFLFAVLTLPLAIAETSAVSPDGLIYALAAAAASLASPAFTGGAPIGRGHAVAIAACIGCLATTRPVSLPPAALVPMLRGPTRAFRLWLLLAIAGVTLTWAVLMAWLVMVPLYNSDPAGGRDPMQQLHLLLMHPAAIVNIAGNTFADYAGTLLMQFIGAGEWALPDSSIVAAYVVLGLVLLLGIPADTTRWSMARSLALLVALATAASPIFGIQFLSWTRPGELRVDGVQGRYFIPLALFLPLLAPRLRLPSLPAQIVSACGLAVFPGISLALLLCAVVRRFNLT